MSKDKTVPHVHAELIHAWADGQDIEWSFNGSEWNTANVNSGEVLSWSHRVQYRVKPKPPANIELYANAELLRFTDISGGVRSGGVRSGDLMGNFSTEFIETDNLKLTFCGLTGKLVGAEVVQHEKAGDYE